MKICIICKGKFEAQPPIMSLALALNKSGHEVEILTDFSEQETKTNFQNLGVSITALFSADQCTGLNFFSKIVYWKTFARRAWRLIDKKYKDCLLWIATADTALALGDKLLNHHYVLQILELYDTFPFYRYMLSKYARKASCVVVPEMCRAAIFRSWYDLDVTPIVLPNKPYSHPFQRNLEIEDPKAEEVLAKCKSEEKIVLFQGYISMERDIRSVAEAVGNMGGGWKFVLMGYVQGNYLEQLKERCPEIMYIPPVTAPAHLQVTSHAHVGVITYSWDRLNHVFCAPNKIWEYAGFGLPMICNDLPSLQAGVQANNAGLCIDMGNVNVIQAALRDIDDDYERFSKAALKLYHSVDMPAIVSRAVELSLSKKTSY